MGTAKGVLAMCFKKSHMLFQYVCLNTTVPVYLVFHFQIDFLSF